MTFAERNAGQFGYLLLLVIATFVVGSLMPYHGWQGVVISVVGSLTALFGLVAARARPSILRAATVAALVSIATAFVSALAHSVKFEGGTALIQMLLFLLTAAAVLRAVIV